MKLKFYSINYILLILVLIALVLNAVLYEYCLNFVEKNGYIFLTTIFIAQAVIFIYLTYTIKCINCSKPFLINLHYSRKGFGDIRFEKMIFKILLNQRVVCSNCNKKVGV